MLTQEQIKNLKEGDPIVINGKFKKVDKQGDLWMDVDDCLFWFSPSCVSLPSEKPKYDPTRPFKKGDRAQVVERNGRNLTCFPVGRIKVGDIVTVAENETGDVFIKVLTEDGHEMMAPWFMLELVTPVVELEPYSVELLQDGLPPDTYHFWAVMDDTGQEVARFWCEQYEEGKAKAAAVAERDRLNSEYRKEQNNGNE